MLVLVVPILAIVSFQLEYYQAICCAKLSCGENNNNF